MQGCSQELGVATGAIGIVSEALISILGIAYAIYGVLVMVWFLAIGWQPSGDVVWASGHPPAAAFSI